MDWKSGLKKVGKVVVDGTKRLVDYSKEVIQIRKWEEQILRRMNKGQLIQLCREKKIATITTRHETKTRRDGSVYFKPYKHKYTYGELVSILKNRLQLNEVIDYAKRKNVRINDIIAEIEKAKYEKEIKQLEKQGKDIHNDYWDVFEAIREFKPFKKYNNELPYQIDLARWLQQKFPNTRIEESRGSSRPDIVIRGIAIEVKGPTFHRDLQTVADKCMRYCQHYPKGMIVVLFDLTINQRLYREWINGMKNNYPDVKVIKI